ncbi:rubisco activase [Actinidia rufa]|uniref:Rubisco activase n=1 Tax=Actinidia rufa TaxID=165716 RepID=A0A7J0E8B0_9ERIC|nr:rubisco activase [Actinidia rufa]
MATAFSAAGAVNRALFIWNGSRGGTSVPSPAFFGKRLKKVSSKANARPRASSGQFKVVAEVDEKKQTDRIDGRALYMTRPTINRTLPEEREWWTLSFRLPCVPALATYNLDNTMDGFYIAPASWTSCPIMMSAGELESGNAGEPAKLIRQRYREAADIIRKGKICALFINDLDAGAASWHVRQGGNPVSQLLSPEMTSDVGCPSHTLTRDGVRRNSIGLLLGRTGLGFALAFRRKCQEKACRTQRRDPDSEQPKMTLEKLLEYRKHARPRTGERKAANKLHSVRLKAALILLQQTWIQMRGATMVAACPTIQNLSSQKEQKKIEWNHHVNQFS